jgi:hypothetical protein
LEEKDVRFLSLSIIVALLASVNPWMSASAQSKNKAGAKNDAQAEEIIKKFTEKETEFYEAWKQYTYTQNTAVKILSVNGEPIKNESLSITSEVVFDDDGEREIKVVRERGRLKNVRFTDDDRQIINNMNPFALTADELPLYKLKYMGKEKVDELDCFVFSVQPKSIRQNHLYFDGKIWVDDRDYQVVRTVGKPVPQTGETQFPEFETLRQIVDNKYWFPVWTHANSVLHFSDKDVKIEETITYEDYKKFGTSTKIEFGDEKK